MRKILNVLGSRPFGGCGRLNLHQADFTGFATPIRMKTRFLPNDGFHQEWVYIITSGRGADLCVEFSFLVTHKANIHDRHRNHECHQK